MCREADWFVMFQRIQRAKKEHECGECGRIILPKEEYESAGGPAEDGNWETYKTCMFCLAAREWLARICSTWIYNDILDDLEEHQRDGYGNKLTWLVALMRREWQRHGKLLSVEYVTGLVDASLAEVRKQYPGLHRLMEGQE